MPSVEAAGLVFSRQENADHPHRPSSWLPKAGVNAAVGARKRDEIVRGHGVPTAGVPDRESLVRLSADKARRHWCAIPVPTASSAQRALEAGVPRMTTSGSCRGPHEGNGEGSSTQLLPHPLLSRLVHRLSPATTRKTTSSTSIGCYHVQPRSYLTPSDRQETLVEVPRVTQIVSGPQSPESRRSHDTATIRPTQELSAEFDAYIPAGWSLQLGFSSPIRRWPPPFSLHQNRVNRTN